MKKTKTLILLILSVSLVTGVMLMGGCVGKEVDKENEAPPQEIPAEIETPSREATQIIEDITPLEAFALIQQNQGNSDFVIIDVRTPEEFSEGYIEGAINIDFYSETFPDELNILDKNKTYLIYCLIGGRSGSALDIMEELNFREAYNMTGGIIQWQAEGFPTVK